MRCAAVASSTRSRCGRHARPGSRFCALHEGSRVSVPEVLSDESRSLVRRNAVIAALDRIPEEVGVDGEIALLRRQIREAADADDWKSMWRGIDTLCKALRVQHVLVGRSADNLAGSLARVLEEIGNEIGVAL
ncbi:MAG TPA: hypothetical protein VF960_08040 [Chloroflexota bacterium]